MRLGRRKWGARWTAKICASALSQSRALPLKIFMTNLRIMRLRPLKSLLKINPAAYLFEKYLSCNIILYMTHSIGEKRLKLVLLPYLILALIVSSAISTAEAFCIEYSRDDRMSSGGCFCSISHTIDWLAGETLTLRKDSGYSNSPLRNGLLRVFTFAGTISIALYLAGANLKIIKNDNIQIIRNLVLLKLRI